MVFPPIAAWLAARNQRDKMPVSNIPHVTMPIFETVEEARKSLSIEKGNHEFRIKESPIAVNLFDVCWVEDNELYHYTYDKKVTGYK